MAIALFALLGLLVGSFLNVVIHRVPRGESLSHPPSHCPHCSSRVRAYHNVPVLSWLMLRGRCADCRASISARYPLIEALTAALFAAITWHTGLVPQLAAYLYLAALGVALAAIDIDVRRLPDILVLPSYGIAWWLLSIAAAADSAWWSLGRAALGMVALGLLYLGIAFVAPDGIGLGDVKLAGLLGVFLGWAGWSALIVGGMGAFLAGSIVALAVAARRRAFRGIAIPFGPSMVAAAIAALFIAAPVAGWYGVLAGTA